MILEALVKHYESLLSEGKVPIKGWSVGNVSFALELNHDGDLVRILPLTKMEQRGKKQVEVPQAIIVPEKVKRAANIASQFLCDNSSYFFGIDNKSDNEDKAKRSLECFEAAAKLHQNILASGTSNAAVAVKNFFYKWDPHTAYENEIIQPYKKEILAGGNLIFMVDNKYAQEDEEVKSLWNKNCFISNDAVVQQCLVTGKKAPIARLHPLIKGILGAQTAGASLVSFNAPAYESYGHVKGQGLNAPVSEYAAFAYGTILNKLLADKKHVKTLGDTTVVYWAEKNSEIYQDVFAGMFYGNQEFISDDKLDDFFSKVKADEEINFRGIKLSYDNKFYVLGLSPNAARISVRFFLQNTFGGFAKNILEHYERMKISKPAFEKFNHIPLWILLQETVHKNAKKETASPLMAGVTMKAILNNTLYPVSLFQNIMLRIRAEEGDNKINYRRAAILKAYLNKNKGRNITVGLDENMNDIEYVLGRLFAILEHIQESANPGINATIKDKYFDSACATPAKVFPILQKLSNHHLRKLDIKQKIYFEKQLTDIMGKIEMGKQPLPKYLPLEKQSIFILGYYHQTQKRYTKKEEN